MSTTPTPFPRFGPFSTLELDLLLVVLESAGGRYTARLAGESFLLESLITELRVELGEHRAPTPPAAA